MQDNCRICEYPSSPQKFCLILSRQRLLRLGLGFIYLKSIVLYWIRVMFALTCTLFYVFYILLDPGPQL